MSKLRSHNTQRAAHEAAIIRDRDLSTRDIAAQLEECYNYKPYDIPKGVAYKRMSIKLTHVVRHAELMKLLKKKK